LLVLPYYVVNKTMNNITTTLRFATQQFTLSDVRHAEEGDEIVIRSAVERRLKMTSCFLLLSSVFYAICDVSK